MRDHDQRAPLREGGEAGHERALGLGVEMGGGFVGDDQFACAMEGAREREPLDFPARQAPAIFSEPRAPALRQAGDHLTEPGSGEGVQRPRARRTAQRDVLLDIGVEHMAALRHIGDAPTPLAKVAVGEIDAVNQDFAVRRRGEAE